MMDDALEGGDDAAEHFGEFAAGDEDIVDLEKDLQAVALAGKLRLVGLGSFEIEGIVRGNGDLAGDTLHELKLGVRDALRNDAAETHGAKAALRRGQRNNREGADIVFAEALHEIGEARLLFGVADDEGLLRLPDPAGGVALDGSLGAGMFFARDASFENMETHDVAGGVVKDKGEEIEIDDGMETLGKVVEKRGKIALLGDGLADFEQGFELTPGVFQRGRERHFRRRNNGVRHTRQDNTRVGEGST